MKTTERIQYAVDNADKKMMRARSHFRARLWSPLVLFHGENSMRKKCIGQPDWMKDPLHYDVNSDGEET